MASLIEVNTKFQNIKIDPSNRNSGDVILFCDDAWQLDTAVEFKYHESLITIPMAASPAIVKVLICGGGDGMALREVLKFPEVHQATLVEIDPGMISLFRDDARWSKFNNNSMKNPRAKVVTQDALAYARETPDLYDLIVLDFPSPSGSNSEKNYPNLYSPASLEVFLKKLKPSGVLSMQVSMPYIFLAATAQHLLSKGFYLWNYDTYYNTRNADSFMIASKQNLTQQRALPTCRFANPERIKAAFSKATQVEQVSIDYFRLFCHGEDVEYEYS